MRSALFKIVALGLVLSLSGCSYFIGDLAQIAPRPQDVKVIPPFVIESVNARVVETGYRQDEGYWDCWWVPWWPFQECGWVSYWVWTETHVYANILLTIKGNDRGNDLVDVSDKPSRVRIGDSELAPGVGKETCQIPVTIVVEDHGKTVPSNTVTTTISAKL